MVNRRSTGKAMTASVAMTTLVVDDYDRAIAFACDGLGLTLVADTEMGAGKRWVVVGGPAGGRLLLAKADGPLQRAAIGNQTGGRVGFFVESDDFERDRARLVEHGVRFLESPRQESYGTVAVFEDPFGNKWDLIQPTR
jgi:catechol 2,3-dioxygenase-like lactoylglutathione lyase family enzyme